MFWRLNLIVAASLLVAACATAPPPSRGDLTLHLIGINDFHGNLEAPRGGLTIADPADPAKTKQVPAGGAARLATVVKQLRARDPKNTIMVGAGDLVGASPLLSSLFHDEPTVESMSQIGLALSAVGNHEFDEGPAELKRLQTGGCHPVDGCKGPTPFKGAKYQYLAASTVDTATGKTLFPPYAIREFEGIKVGFVGLSLKSTPELVVPSGTAGLTFKDEAQTINDLVPVLRGQGVEAIVVLIHEGGWPAKGLGDCPGISGAITEIVPKLDKAVDMIVSGHTHQAYVCTIDGRLVTSAGLYGMMLSDITVTLNRATHDVTSAKASNIVITPDFAEDADEKALIDSYRLLAAPLMTRVVGKITATLTASAPHDGPANGESQLGEIVADSMRAAAAKTVGEPIDIAFMNGPGLRGALTFKGDGSITYADIFTVQPFNNTLTVMTLTGADIAKVLDQQFDDQGPTALLQISEGFSYAWRKGADGEGSVVPGSITVGGKPLDAGARYRIVTNNYLAEGGDFFTAFKAGTDEKIGGADSAALEDWFAAHSPLGPPPLNRIRIAP
jgi:5'-nucleotidase